VLYTFSHSSNTHTDSLRLSIINQLSFNCVIGTLLVILKMIISVLYWAKHRFSLVSQNVSFQTNPLFIMNSLADICLILSLCLSLSPPLFFSPLFHWSELEMRRQHSTKPSNVWFFQRISGSNLSSPDPWQLHISLFLSLPPLHLVEKL